MPAVPLSSLHATAFVTGASAGLGRAFTDMLLAEGVRVWGTARDPARLASLAAHPNFTAVVLDLRDGPAVEQVFADASVSAGGFDLVINNAGYGVFAGALEADADVWHGQLEDMLQTTLRLGRAALCGMRPRGRGCLVNVSSLAVEFPLPYMSGYNVAKAGLSAWSESLAYELAGTDVRVIDLRPGDFQTGFNRSAARGSGGDAPAAARVWARLGRNLDEAPLPAHAAADLRRALLARRGGIVRTGSFFQARLAPLLSRLAPWSWRHAVQKKFFHLS
ncbi:MAG: SDR family NAD(P)-dependent oxidoreductase [Verrucomicrobia bacterium]|nr:SDR family NAD(P)-dependent oxidoreductase [Verrucomicrobiota bacterium]